MIMKTRRLPVLGIGRAQLGGSLLFTLWSKETFARVLTHNSRNLCFPRFIKERLLFALPVPF